MKKGKLRHVEFFDEVYSAGFVAVQSNRDDMRAFVKKRWGVDIGVEYWHSGYCVLLENKEGGIRFQLIWIRDDVDPKTAGGFGVIVHEAYHAMEKVLGARGIGADSEEARAYYITYLVEQISEKLFKMPL